MPLLLAAAAGAACRASWLRIRELAVLPSSLKMKVASEELVDSEPSSVEDEELEEVEDEEEVDRERPGTCSRHIKFKGNFLRTTEPQNQLYFVLFTYMYIVYGFVPI